jgi:hypothetical protein
MSVEPGRDFSARGKKNAAKIGLNWTSRPFILRSGNVIVGKNDKPNNASAHECND